jgi:hypothetical protein
MHFAPHHRAFVGSGVAVHNNKVAWIGAPRWWFWLGHTSPSPLRSFASVIAQRVDAVPIDVC